ncbi:Adaptive-response sensory-kinase SasA [Dyadobacter sp. CECT 9275]|uniref:Adaptive-response sensory-kinase SasA n=1 Tax=Dyadobacter helix TaxID=2822344 RepID=A0A916JBB3_9BACT|nr:HAMP domain-containing sensor histidine kinase [Dyadobacter sp. CECT 9275]CAG4999044.1 Adaptive-response sensory-kinase SasA [Dyadobacter sp. CECT 9275]
MRHLLSLAGFYFRILFVGFCFTYPASLYGQEYSFKHYNSENSLPQNSIDGIVTDSKGYLWFSTQAGITRFDGREFVVLNATQIPSMFSDRIGWIGVDNHHRVYFKDEGDKLFRQKGDGLQFEPVDDSSSVHIIGFYNAHVTEIRKSEFLKRNPIYPQVTNPVTNAQTSDGTSWTYFHDPKTDKGVLNFFSASKAGYVSSERIQNSLMLQFSDTLCFLNRSGQASFMKNGKYLHAGPIETGISFDQKSRILYLALANNYLVRDNNLYEIYLIPRLGLGLKMVIKDLPCHNIEIIHKIPGTGIYAIGSSTDGLYLFYPKLFEAITYSPDATLAYTNTYAITTKGDEVINTDYTYHLNSRKFQQHADVVPFFLFRDADGWIYYSKRAQNASAFLFKTKDFVTSEKLGWFQDELCAMQSSLANRNRLYFVTRSQLGYLENNQIKILLDLTPGTIEQPGDMIMQCMLVEKGRILIGTNRGIFGYDLASGSFSPIGSSSKLQVRSIYRDSGNNIFVGTYGKGLFLLSGDKTIELPLDLNKSLKYTHCFMEDGEGRMWVTSNDGLFVVSRKNLLESAIDKNKMAYYHSFDKIQGLPGYEFNGGCSPCAAKNDAGLLFFPSLKGMISVDPKKVSLMYPDKKIYIDRIQIDDSTFHDLDENLLVPRGFSQLLIYVSTPYYGKADNLKIEYFVSQVQNVWAPIVDGKIELKLLLPGDYILRLRKLSFINARPAYIYHDVRFTVLPYWYETTIFRVICTILVCVLIWLGFQFRYRYIIRQNAILEEKIAERSKSQQLLIESLELSYKNLQASENKLQNLLSDKENVFSILVHDLRSPLRYLHKNSAHLAKNWTHYTRQELREVIVQLDCSTKEIHYFTEELMNWMAALDKNQPVEKEELSVAEVVDELSLLYKEILNQNNNTLNNGISPDLKIFTNRFLLKTVLRNLIDNANKNTEYGNISILAVREGNCVVITVSDDGTGMSDEMILNMNTYLQGDAESSKVNSQFGHIIMKDALRALEGTLEYSKTSTTLNANIRLKDEGGTK